jgi:ribosomal protein S18 acetylase RimI-like enzyme
VTVEQPFEIRDRKALERFLRRTESAHVYALADLDDAFWSDTRWFALRKDGELAAVCLLLEKLTPPILYAIAEPGDPALRALLAWLLPSLPAHVFATPGLGLSDVLARAFEIRAHGEHLKMALDPALLPQPIALAGIAPLDLTNFAELRAFYADDAYRPEERHGRFFESYMLEQGPWFGVREAGRLVSVAGVHVLSTRTSVAAIGGVATRPDRRGRGLARALTARLCRSLLERVALVGLNVAAANAPAIHVYRSLGFREVVRYEEMELRRRAAR